MYHGPKCYSTNCVWRKNKTKQNKTYRTKIRRLKGQITFRLTVCGQNIAWTKNKGTKCLWTNTVWTIIAWTKSKGTKCLWTKIVWTKGSMDLKYLDKMFLD